MTCTKTEAALFGTEGLQALEYSPRVALLSPKSPLTALVFHVETRGMRKACGRNRIREAGASLSSLDHFVSGQVCGLPSQTY